MHTRHFVGFCSQLECIGMTKNVQAMASLNLTFRRPDSCPNQPIEHESLFTSIMVALVGRWRTIRMGSAFAEIEDARRPSTPCRHANTANFRVFLPNQQKKLQNSDISTFFRGSICAGVRR